MEARQMQDGDKLPGDFALLLEKTSPHLLLVSLLKFSGLSPGEIADEFLSHSLASLLESATQKLADLNWLGDQTLRQWCLIVNKRLQADCQVLFSNDPQLRRCLKPLPQKQLAETTLNDYFERTTPDPTGDINSWSVATTDIGLVASARSGYRSAFDTLRDRYETALEGRIKTHEYGRDNFTSINRKLWHFAWNELGNYSPDRQTVTGFFRNLADLLCLSTPAFNGTMDLINRAVLEKVNARVFKTSEREDVAQDARFLVWDKFHKYDPKYGTFRQFIVYWTDIAIRRSIPTNPSADYDPAIEEEPDNKPLPGRRLRDKEEGKQILRKAFSECNQPHANIAFGFNITLEWKPQEIARDLWTVPMRSLVEKLENDLASIYPIGKNDINDIVAPLKESLSLQNREMKTFNDFAPANHGLAPAEAESIACKAVYNWVNNIMKRLRKEFVN